MKLKHKLSEIVIRIGLTILLLGGLALIALAAYELYSIFYHIKSTTP